MQKVYFKSSCLNNRTKAVIFGKKGLIRHVRTPQYDADNNHYLIDFDSKTHKSLCFYKGYIDKTSKVFPGKISIGVEYKYCNTKKQNLTYLYSQTITKTGRVENYILEDSKNLSYRKDNSKKISIFIPDSYDSTTPYDILYFFDAQNLFSNAGIYTQNGDPYGSWQLDIVLSEIYRQYGKGIIVVGIDNADVYRSQELFMNPDNFGDLSMLGKNIPNDNFSVGYLDELSSFIIETLHPFVKAKYYVSENNIGIGGSSMGGIAAFYCGIREIGFYKYILSYSPAYGLYKMSAFDNFFGRFEFTKNQEILPKVHIYCGAGDPLEKMLLPSAKNMKRLMIKHGYPEKHIFETYDHKKPHNEESWRLILPESFSLLLDL